MRLSTPAKRGLKNDIKSPGEPVATRMNTFGSPLYRFGPFELNPGARQLTRDDTPVELPRRVFDCLVFLVEHRDQAHSRDELITRLWGHADVADAQLIKLVSHLRQALGDDSHDSRFVRTVPGFGYGWIADTTREITVEAAAAGKSGAGRYRRTAVMGAGLVLLVLILVLLATRMDKRAAEHEQPLPREPGQAVVVLPLETAADDATDAGWIRLGVMDLVAGRLREAGLPVPPSDSVVAVWHAHEGKTAPERLVLLRGVLQAGILVHGRAIQAPDGWRMELTATTADGEVRHVRSDAADIIPAALQASNNLLAALGRPAWGGAAEGSDSLSERLQRVRAATLALEFDTARALLTRDAAVLAAEPELRNELAWIALHSGQLDEAEALASALLDDPQVSSHPRLHARVLTLRGIVALSREEQWAAAVPHVDAAVAALEHELWAPELAAALAVRAMVRVHLRDFAPAVQDLARARVLFEASGDRQGGARIHNYLGYLELERGRPAEALHHFETALDVSEAFGMTLGIRANLHALLAAQTRLLHWEAGLSTVQRLLALRERVGNPAWVHGILVEHAVVLMGLGQIQEAGTILAELETMEAGLQARSVCYSEHARARLAWTQGRPDEALRAASRALALWPEQMCGAESRPSTRVALLRQRAALATGVAPEELPIPAIHRRDAAALVMLAERAAHLGDDDQAATLFREALELAGTTAEPDTLLLVAQGQANWLLARGRVAEALPLSGLVADWAGQDYDSALLQTRVLHAAGHPDAWAVALRRARDLAGERPIPSALLAPPVVLAAPETGHPPDREAIR